MRDSLEYNSEYFLGYYELYEAVPAKLRKVRAKVSPLNPEAIQPDTPEAAQERQQFSFRQRPRKQVVQSPHQIATSSAGEESMYAPLWTSPRKQSLLKAPLTSSSAAAAGTSARTTVNPLARHNMAGWAGARINAKAQGSHGSSKVTAADKLADNAKRAAQGKGKAVASSPSSSSHMVGESSATAQAKGRAVASSPSSSLHDAADLANSAQAPVNLGNEISHYSDFRRSPSSSSAMTHQGPHELRHCACCWRTDTPTWRNGKSKEYLNQLLCNACQMWEGRHKGQSLNDTSKRDAFRGQYEAKRLTTQASLEAGAASSEGGSQALQGSNGQRGEGRRGSHSASTALFSKGPAAQPSGELPQSSKATARRSTQPNAALQHGKKKRKRTADAAGDEGSAQAKMARQGSSNSPGAASANQGGGGAAGPAVAAVAAQPVSTIELRPRLYKRLTEDRWFQEDDVEMEDF